MNTNIETAIASLCDDIATNTDVNDNYKRAEAILFLSFSNIFAPKSLDNLDNEYEGESESECPAVSGEVPKAGQHFNYYGTKFVALGEEQGGILAVVAECLEDEMPYDENGCNDWRKSTLRKYLNEEYIKDFDKADLIPIVSDLTADSGEKDYGTSEDYIALLSDSLYRKYREFMPKYNNWIWTITPWAVAPGGANYERCVDTSGALSHNYAGYGYGVAPACIFNPSIFE